MLSELKHCPICGSASFAPDFVAYCTRRNDGRTWPISRCSECTVGFINPQPDWSELSAYYDATYDPYVTDHGVGSPDIEAIKAAGGEFRHIIIRPGLRLLDIGCGGGAFLAVARALGAVVYGVEPSAHGAKMARSQALDVFHGQLHEFLESDERTRRFDAITMNHVIEHHPAPVEALKQAKSLLAPGGFIWFSAPNIQSTTARVLKHRWHSTDAPYHLMHFTPAAARIAVERAGLAPRRLYTYSLPSAAFASYADIWRYRYLAPRSLTLKLPMLRRLAGRRAAQMDAAGSGEAVIVEAVPA